MNDKSIFETEGSMISLLNWPVITGRHKRIKTLTYEKNATKTTTTIKFGELINGAQNRSLIISPPCFVGFTGWARPSGWRCCRLPPRTITVFAWVASCVRAWGGGHRFTFLVDGGFDCSAYGTNCSTIGDRAFPIVASRAWKSLQSPHLQHYPYSASSLKSNCLHDCTE